MGSLTVQPLAWQPDIRRRCSPGAVDSAHLRRKVRKMRPFTNWKSSVSRFVALASVILSLTFTFVGTLGVAQAPLTGFTWSNGGAWTDGIDWTS